MEFPDYPDFGFLLVYRRTFLKEYDRRASQKIRAGLNRKDNLVRRLMFQGRSHADALAEAVEIMAKVRKRDDLAAREQELDAISRRLSAKEQDVDNRIAMGRAAVLVKPVSLTQRLMPAFTHGKDEIAPLPAFPVWKNEADEEPGLLAA